MLDAFRQEIDGLDAGIVELLCRRLEVVQEIAAVKQAQGLAVRDAERERQLLDRVRAIAGERWQEPVAQVYEAILCASRAQQEALRGADAAGAAARMEKHAHIESNEKASE